MVFLIPFLSVMIGFAFAMYFRPKNKIRIKLLLAFSGSFLLSITIIDLLPDVYLGSNKKTGIFIMIGILFQIILEFFSKGAEHGHVHGNQKMSRIPWLLFFSLCIHAFFEGLPVSHHQHLGFGIAIHHLPISIILTTFFINAELNKKSILMFMLAFAIMTPLGVFATNKISFFNDFYTETSAIVVGILFHISTTIIFESSEGHKFNFAKISMIAIGIVLAYFI
jgi:zinc transporter ZupT